MLQARGRGEDEDGDGKKRDDDAAITTMQLSRPHPPLRPCGIAADGGDGDGDNDECDGDA